MKTETLVTALLVAATLSGCAASDPYAERIEVVRRLYASTLQILAKEANGVRRTGSGVVVAVDADRYIYIVTARHVIERLEGTEISVVGHLRKKAYEAKVLVMAEQEDLALLKTRGPDVAAAKLGGTAWLGEDVWVVSYPWGRRRTLVTGVVSQIEWLRPPAGEVPLEGPVSLVDATVGYGTSGGGVFDGDSGRLLGIIRGYRSVQLSVDGPDKKPVSLPIAGETTVISVERIRKFLADQGYGKLVPPPAPQPPPETIAFPDSSD